MWVQHFRAHARVYKKCVASVMRARVQKKRASVRAGVPFAARAARARVQQKNAHVRAYKHIRTCAGAPASVELERRQLNCARVLDRIQLRHLSASCIIRLNIERMASPGDESWVVPPHQHTTMNACKNSPKSVYTGYIFRGVRPVSRLAPRCPIRDQLKSSGSSHPRKTGSSTDQRDG